LPSVLAIVTPPWWDARPHLRLRHSRCDATIPGLRRLTGYALEEGRADCEQRSPIARNVGNRRGACVLSANPDAIVGLALTPSMRLLRWATQARIRAAPTSRTTGGCEHNKLPLLLTATPSVTHQPSAGSVRRSKSVDIEVLDAHMAPYVAHSGIGGPVATSQSFSGYSLSGVETLSTCGSTRSVSRGDARCSPGVPMVPELIQRRGRRPTAEHGPRRCRRGEAATPAGLSV
jgi:hypothetical protein